jgi:hypothetical protein
MKERREFYRPCLPGSYEVERIISSRGRGEVFYVEINLYFIVHTVI